MIRIFVLSALVALSMLPVHGETPPEGPPSPEPCTERSATGRTGCAPEAATDEGGRDAPTPDTDPRRRVATGEAGGARPEKDARPTPSAEEESEAACEAALEEGMGVNVGLLSGPEISVEMTFPLGNRASMSLGGVCLPGGGDWLRGAMVVTGRPVGEEPAEKGPADAPAPESPEGARSP